MLTALILLVCVSVFGRMLNTILHGPLESLAPALTTWALGLGVGPINGDFELVEAGIAFAIFAFLPYCQMTSGHASVDIFTAPLPEKARRILRAIIEFVFALALIIIAVQLFEGMASKRRYGETTFLLQFPVWWSYAMSLFAAVVAAATAVYMAFIRIMEMFKMQPLIDDAPETGH